MVRDSQQAAPMGEVVYVSRSHTLPGPELPLSWELRRSQGYPRTEGPYLVCPFCGEIPRKPIKKDKRGQVHV